MENYGQFHRPNIRSLAHALNCNSPRRFSQLSYCSDVIGNGSCATFVPSVRKVTYIDRTLIVVIVEDKLSTNRECRRDVLAQILEYAHSVQTSLSLDDLPDNISDWVEEYRDDIRRGMRTGDFLLIICGDAIDRSLMNLVRSYVDRLDPSNLSDLVLIAMAIYSDGETHVLVPHVAAGTERAVRDLTVRVEIQAVSGVPLEIGKIRADETPEEGRRRPRGERVVIPPEIFMRTFRSYPALILKSTGPEPALGSRLTSRSLALQYVSATLYNSRWL